MDPIKFSYWKSKEAMMSMLHWKRSFNTSLNYKILKTLYFRDCALLIELLNPVFPQLFDILLVCFKSKLHIYTFVLNWRRDLYLFFLFIFIYLFIFYNIHYFRHIRFIRFTLFFITSLYYLINPKWKYILEIGTAVKFIFIVRVHLKK